MAEFLKICLTTDFSRNAEAALPAAASIGRSFNSTMLLVHVFDGSFLYDAALEADEGQFPNPAHWIDPIYHKLEIRLKQLAADYSQRENIAFTPVLLKGDTIDEIVKFIRTNGIDCLAIATHGRRGVSHLLHGSVAERLVRISPCPVLSVRPNVPGP